MELNKENMRKIRWLIAFAVLLYLGIQNLAVVLKYVKLLWGLLLPFVPKEVQDSLDLVVLSPGVPTDLPIVKGFYEQGLPVWGEVELAPYRGGSQRDAAIRRKVIFLQK